MHVIDHGRQPLEEWRPGVMTRMHASALTGAGQLCVFEQFCEPGCGAPTHRHIVEEILTVLDGEAEVWVGDQRAPLAAGQSVVVPPGDAHGFLNVGQGELHVRAILAAPVFEGAFENRSEITRRWVAA